MAGNDSDGRCGSCGFLSQFDYHTDGPPPHFYEYPIQDRQQPGETVVRLEKDWQITTFPRCYFNCADLLGEIDGRVRSESTTRTLATWHVLWKDRNCHKWHPYSQGFSPQEHWEEVRMQELELKRQQFEQKMVNDHKAFMTLMEDRNWWFQFWIAFILGAIAVLEILVGIFQLLYPSGLPWFQSPPPLMPGV